ncbi:hypothetical protein J6590_018847 [Homalodisca vitripennis]|nr:hypothetical protein J6590_018847 [Homalodisca vitripennis]
MTGLGEDFRNVSTVQGRRSPIQIQAQATGSGWSKQPYRKCVTSSVLELRSPLSSFHQESQVRQPGIYARHGGLSGSRWQHGSPSETVAVRSRDYMYHTACHLRSQIFQNQEAMFIRMIDITGAGSRQPVSGYRCRLAVRAPRATDTRHLANIPQEISLKHTTYSYIHVYTFANPLTSSNGVSPIGDFPVVCQKFVDLKKKVIVKVPHVIKHIHHNHFKPIHVHKVHAKKVEHHHHEKHEEELGGWEHEYKRDGGKHKAKGSYSNLKPVLVHHDVNAHTEYHRNHDTGYKARNEYEHGQELGTGHRHGLESEFISDKNPAKRRNKEKENNSREVNGKWTPVDLAGWMKGGESDGEYSGEEWFVSSEDLSDLKGFSNGKGLQRNGNNKVKAKPLNWRTKYINPEQKDDGWKPMMDFSGWKDVKDIRLHDDQFIHSEEDYSESSNESKRAWERNNNKKRGKKNKKAKWSKQIEVREPIKEEDYRPQLIQQNQRPYQVERPTHLVDHGAQLVQKNQRPYQVEKPAHLVNHRPQLVQKNQRPYQEERPAHFVPQNSHHEALQTQEYAWQSGNGQEQKSWPASPQQPHHWNEQPPQAPLWHPPQAHLQPQPSPTEPSTVIWSGHHLQMPQHTMWHVQQHSVKAVPNEIVPLDSNPLPPLPVSQPLLPLHQHQPTQLQQPSAPVHQVLPPDWPLIQNSPHQNRQVKQHWEQSVHTSGRDGPASSYKVEVINYADHNSSHR